MGYYGNMFLLHSRGVWTRNVWSEWERDISVWSVDVKFSAAKLQKFYVIRKQIRNNLQKHFSSIQLKYEIDANGADLPRSEELETVRKKAEYKCELVSAFCIICLHFLVTVTLRKVHFLRQDQFEKVLLVGVLYLAFVLVFMQEHSWFRSVATLLASVVEFLSAKLAVQ